MAKTKDDPITALDLIEFLEHYSDFGFEVEVLNALAKEQFECDHSGTYDDPHTDKPRQFDIRATWKTPGRVVRLAVECKRLKTSFPLLVSCLPRTENESFHEVIFAVDNERCVLEEGLVSAMRPIARSLRVQGEHSFYKSSDFVGKATDQVGRNNTKEGTIVVGDSEVYAKWAQAVSSSQDLADRGCSDGLWEAAGACLSVVLPILVIPVGTLWITRYHQDGSRVSDPEQRDGCPFFINKELFAGGKLQGTSYTISHLEIMTLAGLTSFVQRLRSGTEGLDQLFPSTALSAAVGNTRS